jgi:hypothetical protein
MNHIGKIQVVRKAFARVEIRNVGAGGKGAVARASYNYDAYVGIRLKLAEGVTECLQHVQVEHVEGLGPIDGDDTDRPINTIDDNVV